MRRRTDIFVVPYSREKLVRKRNGEHGSPFRFLLPRPLGSVCLSIKQKGEPCWLSLLETVSSLRLEADARADLYYTAGVGLIGGLAKGCECDTSVVDVDVGQVTRAPGYRTADARLRVVQDVEGLTAKLQ